MSCQGKHRATEKLQVAREREREMKAEALLIAWHMRKFPEPVLACDFHMHSKRFATAGADVSVKVRERKRVKSGEKG